jgi:membrane-associated phospholipid phosphatase
VTAFRSAVALAAAYATLAVLVAAGAFTRVDQWAVEHLMPSASFHGGRPGWLEAAVPLLHQRFDSPLAVAADIVTLPAAALVSLVIVIAAWRVAGPGLLAAWAAGSAVELLCKHVLVRPALYAGTLHIDAFDSSFPSGHALRAVLVACAVAQLWPRAGRVAAVWVIASVVLLQLAGWHTPTDLAGGLLLGGLAALALVGGRAAGAFRARGLLARPRARRG